MQRLSVVVNLKEWRGKIVWYDCFCV